MNRFWLKILPLFVSGLIFSQTGTICKTLRDLKTWEWSKTRAICFTDSNDITQNGMEFLSKSFFIVNPETKKKLSEHKKYRNRIVLENGTVKIFSSITVPNLSAKREPGITDINISTTSILPTEEVTTQINYPEFQKLNAQEIKETKAKFNSELIKLNTDKNFVFWYWENAGSLAKCALNGDKESHEILKNYASYFTKKKGQILYAVSMNFQKIWDGEIMPNILYVIELIKKKQEKTAK